MLAREVNVSRATLARRFAAATGESADAYLERWRMDLAARRLPQGLAAHAARAWLIRPAISYWTGSRCWRRSLVAPGG